MNEKTSICTQDLKKGTLKEGKPYRFGCGTEQIVVAVQELQGFYWIKTQESEALFDSAGSLTVLGS